MIIIIDLVFDGILLGIYAGLSPGPMLLLVVFNHKT
jgi:hypothetical protein